MKSIDQVDGDHGWQTTSVPEAGHRGGRSTPGSRFNQIEASPGEPTLWEMPSAVGASKERMSGEPALHLSRLKSWLN